MPNVSHSLLQQYVKLTEFLGQTLGPDYEIALHDLTEKDGSIIAIANNHVSGREVGAPMTSVALGILKDKSYENEDYRLHGYGLTINGKTLRSSTMFLKQDGKLIGMLCINFDDSRYRAVSDYLLGLCHPDPFVSGILKLPGLPMEEHSVSRPIPEKFSDSVASVVGDGVNRELERMGKRAEELTTEERLTVIAELERGGIFQLKGSVKAAAVILSCSQASMYRYITQLRNAKSD